MARLSWKPCPVQGEKEIGECVRTPRHKQCLPCTPGYTSAWLGMSVFHRNNYTQHVCENVCLLVRAEIGTTNLEDYLAIVTKAQSIDSL